MDFSLGFREVVPDQTNLERWTEFTLNTGGTQSTLQDFKVAEKTGGFCYSDQGKCYTRNRFIYWRISNDTLELIEQSLDLTLMGNRVRYKFTDTPVLDGVTICEVPGAVFVLVATVSSVHRLTFPHPDIIHNKEHVYPRSGIDYSAQSIFADAHVNDARNPATFHVINNNQANCPPHTSASGMTADGCKCLFALAYSSGTILMIGLDVLTGAVNMVELHQQSEAVLTRILSRALRSKPIEENIPISLVLHSFEDETLLFSLCRDGNIRAWSTNRQNCTVATDFPVNSVPGDNHKLKKAVGPQGQLYIGVLHSYPTHSTLKILQTDFDNNLKLNKLESVLIPQEKDVVDFAITGNLEIWAIFHSAAGETALAVCQDNSWLNCELETPWDAEEVPVDVDLDPKQAYLDFLFHPGRFPVSVINKAVSIYRKANVVIDEGVPIQNLKERVSTVVDTQIYGEMREREYSAEELLQLQNIAWQKFYSCVVEYYHRGTRALGLLVFSHVVANQNNSILNKSPIQNTSTMEEEADERNRYEMCTSGVLIIKKSYISLVRPMDCVESVSLNPADTITKSADDYDAISPDLIQLVGVLGFLDGNVPDESKLNFDKSIKQLKSPIVSVAELFAKDLSFGDEDTITSFDLLNNAAMNLEKIYNVEATMNIFLDLLDVGQPDIENEMAVEKSKWLINLGHLYGSQLGMSFISTSIQQIVCLRYVLCRGMLILEQLFNTQSFQQCLLTPKRLSNDLIERTSHLVQCYFVLQWMATAPIYPNQPLDTMENSVSILKLNVTRNPFLQVHRGITDKNITILHLFLKSSASSSVRLLLSRRGIPFNLLPFWKHSFLPYVHILTQLIWPICGFTIFPEFLLLAGQHLHIQEYTRLLAKWCYSNSYTRKFLLACSFLDTGEHNKAFDLFRKASDGVEIDPFISKRIVKIEGDENQRLVDYYIQVMKLFEQQGLHNLVIELAERAISVANHDEPELATLYSVAFLHQLELGRDKEAFVALLANPDSERRKDCLQQLVVTLLDARRLGVLMDFNYDGVRSELERIVEARARSLDVKDNIYYNFAYAYHIKRGSMRKAGAIMYEQALRLSTETGLEALEKQCYCFAVAISALSLVKPEDAWIVKPLPVLDDAMETNEKQVDVLELKDLEKELALCRARLKLIRSNEIDQGKSAFVVSFNANEVMGLLINSGLYIDALKIAKLYDLPKIGVFSGLAGACVRMNESPNDFAWDWLRENDAADLGDGSAATLAWRLLERLLLKEETGRETFLHKCITAKLIHLGVFLPLWLVASYKKRNAAELLRLLLSSGRLEEASELAVEYVSAVLGRGKERFELDSVLLPQHPSVWLPHNTIDLLLLELEAHAAEDEIYKERKFVLKELYDKYIATASSVSQDKLKLLQDECVRMRVC